MDFCPNCSNILSPKKEGETHILICLHCGYKKKLSSKEKEEYRVVDKIEHGPDEEIVVITDSEESHQTMPTTRAVCPKCNNKVAYYWQVQTRSGDEAMTTFYRCTKCKQTWREY